MPAISKIRLTNVVFEDGNKRFNDEVFLFDGHNGAILLENGGGKTVFIHSVLQAVLPHTDLGDRKIKNTLQLENGPAHIGIEWIKSDHPRRYVTTCVSLFLTNNGLDSFRYVFEYDGGHSDSLERIPFVKESTGQKRPTDRGEIQDYYSGMKNKSHNALTFSTLTEFKSYIEEQYQIISNEWEAIVKINRDEGGIEKFFENCRTTSDLYDRLLIPTIEDSIIGHDQTMFADLFEKQRSGFHTYKKLKESIKEYEQIQVELENYVDEFASYARQRESYDLAKRQAKGLWNVIQTQRLAIEKEVEENEKNRSSVEIDHKMYQLKLDSHAILIEDQRKDKLKRAYHDQHVQFEEMRDRLSTDQSHYNSLTYAQLNKELKQHRELLKEYEAHIQTYDSDEIIDAEAEMELEHRKLHGFYQTQIEDLTKLNQGLKVELQPLETEKRRLTEIADQQAKKIDSIKMSQVRYEEQISMKENQTTMIAKQILANPTQEDVRVEQDKWIKRQQFLDEESIQLKQVSKKNDQTIVAIEQAREAQLEESKHLEIEKSNTEIAEKQLIDAHDRLIEELAGIKPRWVGLDNLYMKENAVYTPLIEMEKKLDMEQEALLHKERIARRFVDDYQDQQCFFGDAFLNKQLDTWKNQYDYLISGVEFYQGLSEAEQVSFQNYHLWPITLITTATLKQALIERITLIAGRIQYPITVLTLEEAKQLREKSLKQVWITPEHWQTNLIDADFTKWKETLFEEAEDITAQRKEKEIARRKLNSVRERFQAFFHTYPYQKREELTTQLGELRQKIELINRASERNREKIVMIKEEQATIQANTNLYRDEMNGLTGKIERAREYIQLEKELAILEVSLTEASRDLQQLGPELKQTHRQIKRYQDDINMVESRKQDVINQLSNIKNNDDYQSVQAFSPLFTNEERTVILSRRKELAYRIREIQSSHSELITKRDNENEHVKRIEKTMNTMITMHPDIDQTLEFPVGGAQLLEQLWGHIQTIKVEVDKNSDITSKAKEKMDIQSGQVEALIAQFQKAHPNKEVFKFTIQAETIVTHLKTEADSLDERIKYIKQEEKRIKKEHDNIKAAEIELDRFEEGYHFKSSIIESVALSEKEISDFSYQRMSHVQDLTQKLRNARELLNKGSEEINQAKRRFRDFCQRTITDGKLKNMAIQGVEVKESYEDILTFKQNMMISVERADKYARDYISENDKENEVFISRIHNHLENVVTQLRIIPKQTRVKIDDNWKEIFRFSIPDWTEEDGKSRIRSHIDWILEQLDSDRYLNEHGQEDHGKIRKEIETWLHTKALLKIVMNNNVMKVTCRKVTNDSQVTTRSYSWEQSNQWSGGEKWSKNMTLFLGILNFVAEKKQHIESNMKRHRAVILDNPFGKASSEHVLSPVFFIAEQLGFQIIALTAHAEGKFLQDYFPIIYSCRLRSSIDPMKKVMTKEKSMHRAYFEDHEPTSMERLEEIEQIDLF